VSDEKGRVGNPLKAFAIELVRKKTKAEQKEHFAQSPIAINYAWGMLPMRIN
jgi:hypothetical protein